MKIRCSYEYYTNIYWYLLDKYFAILIYFFELKATEVLILLQLNVQLWFEQFDIV